MQKYRLFGLPLNVKRALSPEMMQRGKPALYLNNQLRKIELITIFYD